ncbi:MAG: tetratricopeptide repeat protein [Myxococcota bacterium]|nr:tetratricopeptide repeat protein [Myxococcota bacterium]
MRIRGRSRTRARRAGAPWALGLCVALWLGIGAEAAASGRMLRGLEVHPGTETSKVRVSFATPVRILRQSPASEGSWVRIELAPFTGRERLDGYPNEIRRPPAAIGSALQEVVYQARESDRAELDLRFDRRVRFDVRPGDDLRSLLVSLTPVAPPPEEETPEAAAPQARAAAPAPEATPAPEVRPGDPELADTYVREGRAALQSGDYDRAALLLEEAATLAEHPRSAEARELLGVTRERNGQRAHAQAEYEAYLERWPDGPGAERVRQRLDALLTAADDPKPALREARAPARPPATSPGQRAPRSPLDDLEVFGSVYTSYSRVQRDSEGSGRTLDDSSFFHDVFTRASLRTDGVDLRAELQASYLFDLLDDDDDWRVSNLFVEVDPRRSRFSGAFGRLPGNRAGILGRFDGARLRYAHSPRLALNAVAGMPFDPFIEPGIDPSRAFVGASVETTLFEDLRLELYGIQQWADGLRDRSGVGAEFSWMRRGKFLAGLVDYDVAFAELNTAFLVGTWQLLPGTTLNGVIDYRRLPTLTRRTALVGQTEDSLDELRRRFATGDIDDLALDRSVRSQSATLGLTQTITQRFQVSGELSLNDFSGSPESGGVGAFPGSGLQVGSFLQLLVSDLLREGDVVTLGFRSLQSRDLDLYALELHWRAALSRKLRVDPFLRLEYRDQITSGGVMTYRPGLRLDYRVGALNLDAEFSYGWGQGERFLGEGDEEGYFLLVGARWDF